MDDESPYWAELLKLRDPAWTDPTDDQQRALTTAVLRLAYGLGGEIWSRADELDALGAPAREGVVTRSPDRALATLRALRAVRGAADAAAENTARKAGQLGAGYPQLGKAWGISRQAARLRWPGAVSAINPAANREPVHFEMYGGEARVSYHPEFGGWWWIATAANRKTAEAPKGDDEYAETSEEAAAAAGAFLAANAVPAAEPAPTGER